MVLKSFYNKAWQKRGREGASETSSTEIKSENKPRLLKKEARGGEVRGGEQESMDRTQNSWVP